MEDILNLYDVEVRENPVSTPGLKVIRDTYVTRLQGNFNFICSWSFAEDKAQEVVTELADHFIDKNKDLMWRVYGHDEPSNLEETLKQTGFKALDPGTLMVLPLSGKMTSTARLTVQKVQTSSQLRDYLSVAKGAFGSIYEGDYEYFMQLLNNPTFHLFVGYVENKPVVSGRLETHHGSSFGLLFGGGVIPEFRGQGFYRELVAARVNLARDLGLKYLSTEAMETSRPILKQLGFIEIIKETTWVLSPKDRK